jgi:hypothetical protein
MGITVITASIPERRRLLAETIESVQSQTCPVDAHLIRVQQPPLGALSPVHLAAQHNAMLAAVDTEWVATLNDDDIYLPEHVESIQPYLGQDADVVYSFAKNEHEYLRIDASDWTPAQVAQRLEQGNFIREAITVRTEKIRQVGGWAGEYENGAFKETGVAYEDWDLLLRLARAGARFRCVPVETWEYRVGDWRTILSTEADEAREPRDLLVLNATYGAEDAFLDVTEAVKALITSTGLAFQATNEAFGADPAVGHLKDLHLTYSVDDDPQERLYQEGTWVNLP